MESYTLYPVILLIIPCYYVFSICRFNWRRILRLFKFLAMVICQFFLYLSSSNIFQFIEFQYCILDVLFRKKHFKSHENQVKVLVLRIGQIKKNKNNYS